MSPVLLGLGTVQQESRQGEIRKESAVNYGRYLVR